jgi:hypothetical protein
MTTQAEPDAMETYFADCARLPALLQPHARPAASPVGRLGSELPGPAISVPDQAPRWLDGLSSYGS